MQGEPLRFSPPRVVVENVFAFGQTSGFFDVAPDGRFLVLQPADTSTTTTTPTSLVIVLNWLGELAERVPAS
jgi:hypothetical protein